MSADFISIGVVYNGLGMKNAIGFGNPDLECKADDVLKDIRLGFRLFRGTPIPTAIAVCSIALSVATGDGYRPGLNAARFPKAVGPRQNRAWPCATNERGFVFFCHP